MFREFISSRLQKENWGRGGAERHTKKVRGRERMDRRKRKMKKEKEKEAAGEEATQRRLCSGLRSGSCLGFSRPVASGSRPWPTTEDNVRRVCLVMCFLLALFVCFPFFCYTSGIEKKEEVRDVAGIDNGPRARVWAGRILSWGLGEDRSQTFDVPGRDSTWVPRARWPAQLGDGLPQALCLCLFPPWQERISP